MRKKEHLHWEDRRIVHPPSGLRVEVKCRIEILGYEIFRSMTNNRKSRKTVDE
jgi:hypothetical protein